MTAVRFLHTSDWQLGMTRHFLEGEAQARYSAARIDAIRHLVETLEQEAELRLQGVTLLVLVEAGKERIGLRLFKQQVGLEMLGQAPRQTGFADADRTFDDVMAGRR